MTSTVAMETFNYIALGISIAGSGIITWGAAVVLFHFFRSERKNATDAKAEDGRDYLSHRFGAYLILGLDFMLAADIIHTIHKPLLNELYVLAIIVGIRSVISFFLVKEMRSISQAMKPEQPGEPVNVK
jgi:uncharacterized membrane protein